MQLGICAGNNQQISAVEYHMGSEVVIALRDCIISLGKVADMQNGSYDGSLMETFLLKRGTAIELFSHTLHYSPLVYQEPYITLVALLRGTNDTLEKSPTNQMLLAKNKYMIVHPSRIDKIAQGALPNFHNTLLD